MGVRQKMLDFGTTLLKSGIQSVARDKTSLVYGHLARELIPIVTENTGIGSLKFFCPGTIPEWRAKTLLTKEPETIEWINTFNKDDILWDIGANIGVYSLYAALRGIKTLAFEPGPGNHYILNKNIELNGYDDSISAFCIAFNDETKMDTFYMLSTELGGAENSFGEAVDWKGETYVSKFNQSMLGFTIDDFIYQFRPPFPNHIKIDVDGIEMKIINGAVTTLANKAIKSVLVELNIQLDECNKVIAIMKTHGLVLFKREHASMFDNGPYSNIYNHIFIRQ